MGINERSLGPEDGSFMNESVSLGQDWVSYHKSILNLLIELPVNVTSLLFELWY